MADTLPVTYDQTPARLPVLDDLHGNLLENVPGKTPGPDHPNAFAMNQGDQLHVAHANVLPSTKLYISFPGGVPTIQRVDSTRTGLVASDFTVTDNGPGDTSITHTGGKLPAVRWPATAHQVDDTEIDRCRAVPIANGTRVKTKLGTVGTDAEVVLEISGI
jgi:hypothetical protein